MISEPASIAFGSRVRKSPFFEATRRAGCDAFSVYNHTYMPLYFEDPEADYWHLVRDVAVWDVACERQVRVTGPDAYAFVRRLTPRNLSKLAVGQAKYVPIVNDAGGMLNDPVLLRVAQDEFWLSIADADILLWAQGVALGSGFDVEIDEPDISPLQVQGPRATEVVSRLCGDWVGELKYFWFRDCHIDGIPVLVSRTGWSNERGYEIFLKDGDRGDELWNRVMTAGEPYGIAPGAPSQIKRMEAGLLSYRNDMDMTNNPFEVRLEKFVDLEQDIDFIGKQALSQICNEGVQRRLMGAIIDGEPVAVNEHRWPVRVDTKVVGELTSSVYSPALQQNLAYVMVPVELAVPGTRLEVDTVAGARQASVCDLPFVANRASDG